MSMISSLDALEAATDATSVPRAALFQPKVKARVRKGGGGANSVPAKPPQVPAPDPVPAATATTAPASQVRTLPASDYPTRISAPAETDSIKPSKASALEKAVFDFVKTDAGEASVAHGVLSNPTNDDDALTQENAPEVLVVPVDGPTTESSSVAASEAFKVPDEVPPVAFRSNFLVPPLETGGVSSDQDVTFRATTDQVPASGPTGEPSVSKNVEESELYNFRNLKSAASPKSSLRGHGSGAKRQAVEDSQPPSRDALEDREGEDQPVAVAEDNTEIISETVPTTKGGGRKRKFSHTTRQPRMNRVEKDGVALKIDFSKTDLSNPGKLTMREIIRRAEAIERKQLKEEGNKRSGQNEGKQNQAAMVDASATDAVSMAPQVQVVNGRIVINEQSLTIGAYATSRLNTETYTRVEENAPRLNYNSYRDKTPTERWKTEDTDVFYLALKQFGTDFELIQNLFPKRTRRQVKAKFKKEERNNPRRLQEALAHRPQDQAHYTDMINRLKCEGSDLDAGEPFANMLAYTKDAATQELADEGT